MPLPYHWCLGVATDAVLHRQPLPAGTATTPSLPPTPPSPSLPPSGVMPLEGHRPGEALVFLCLALVVPMAITSLHHWGKKRLPFCEAAALGARRRRLLGQPLPLEQVNAGTAAAHKGD